MEGRTAYLCHHLDNTEEKIIEGAEESGELPEKYLEAVKGSGIQGADLAQEPGEPRIQMESSGEHRYGGGSQPLSLSQFCQSNRK